MDSNKMKEEEKKEMEKSREILQVFHDAINEAESLSDYYQRSIKTLIAYKMDVEKNYSAGKKIADLIDTLFDVVSAEDRNRRIKEIEEIIIKDNQKLGDFCTIFPFEKDNQSAVSFAINPQVVDTDMINPKKAKDKYEHIYKYEYILTESVLSHIIVSFETFLSSIYRLLLRTNPNKYIGDQTVQLAALFSGRINEIINEKIESEVTSKMYDSISGLRFFAEKENIPLDSYKDLSRTFKELYYRRNAYIHTKGKANKDYLAKVDKKYTKDIKIGEDLVCDDIYLENAICILNKIIFSVVFELLKKEKNAEGVFSAIAYYYFEKLRSKEYNLTKYVYYNMSNCKSIQFYDRLICKINYLIAVKQLDEKDLLKQELEGLDVSAAEVQFKIAKECLCDNFELVFQMLNESYPKPFSAVEIKEWPIFIDFRNTEYYKKFAEAHKEDFAIQQIEDSQSEINELLEEEIHSDDDGQNS